MVFFGCPQGLQVLTDGALEAADDLARFGGLAEELAQVGHLRQVSRASHHVVRYWGNGMLIAR